MQPVEAYDAESGSATGANRTNFPDIVTSAIPACRARARRRRPQQAGDLAAAVAVAVEQLLAQRRTSSSVRTSASRLYISSRSRSDGT